MNMKFPHRLRDFHDRLHVVHPGEKRYSLARNVEVVPLAQLVNAVWLRSASTSRTSAHPDDRAVVISRTPRV